MKVAVAGASGMIGKSLVARLRASGHQVIRLIRHGTASDDARLWNPDEGMLNTEDLQGVDAVVNLAGENIAAGRWTKRRKERILRSRVDSTRTIATALARMDHAPKLLVNASAIGIYGDCGDGVIQETTPPGRGFFPDVGRAWEHAASAAEEAGIRVVLARLGLVLALECGALSSMLPVFRLGLGGRIGSGKQYWSWIMLEDVLRGMEFALVTQGLSGPVNFTSPQPVTNAEFTQALAKVLRRPAFLPVPGFMARLALGEMADAALLASARVIPGKVLHAGFQFRHPELGAALKDCFGNRKDVHT